MTEWRPVGEFPGYEVSDDGRVRGKRGELKPRPRKGYLFVTLSREGKQAKRPISRLVAEAFNGPRPAGLIVRHQDGIRTRNVPSNLVYGTNVENEQDKRAHGSAPIGSNHPAAKLTEMQVLEIRRRYRRMSREAGANALGLEFGVSGRLVWAIVKGRLWKHLSATNQA